MYKLKYTKDIACIKAKTKEKALSSKSCRNRIAWIVSCWKITTAAAYSEPMQTSKMECFSKIVNGLKPLTIPEKKNSILDACSGSKYATDMFCFTGCFESLEVLIQQS